MSKVASFASLSLVGALAPLLVLPVVARVAGSSDWVVIGTCQALGSVASILVMLGWELAGPVKVAMLKDVEESLGIYSESFWARLTVLVTLTPPLMMFILFGLFGSSNIPLAVLSVGSLSVTGLSIIWYSVGIGNPRIAMI